MEIINYSNSKNQDTVLINTYTSDNNSILRDSNGFDSSDCNSADCNSKDCNSKDCNSRKVLDIATVLELWSKTYNTNGKPDWSHLFPYYHPDIVFQDSIQKVVGIDDFKALCERLTNRCKELRMDIISIAEGTDSYDFDDTIKTNVSSGINHIIHDNTTNESCVNGSSSNRGRQNENESYNNTHVRTKKYIIMDWKMTMSFRKSPSTPIFGSTKLTFHEDGRIIEQRDYYDLWGDIFNGIPVFGKLYRKFMSKFFG